MRFRFCGDLDCPDWILAEINTITRMTSIKMKLLCQQVVRQFSGETLDFDKVQTLTADARFETGDMKATVAALTFVMTSSAQHGVSEDALGSELQQLGLPREHSLALCRVYSEQLPLLTQVLCASSLRLAVLDNVDCRVALTSILKPFPEVHLKIQTLDGIDGFNRIHQLVVSEDQLALLVSGLKKAREAMDIF